MIILALDPGRVTSWARLDAARPDQVEIGALETIGAGRLRRPCPLHLAEIAKPADCVVVEEVGARPKQGVSAVFTFGLCTGTVLGAVTALGKPLVLVTPQQWKRAFRLGGLQGEEAKKAARGRALELWPQHHALLRVKENHGLAEAALMALWRAGAGRDDEAEEAAARPARGRRRPAALREAGEAPRTAATA